MTERDSGTLEDGLAQARNSAASPIIEFVVPNGAERSEGSASQSDLASRDTSGISCVYRRKRKNALRVTAVRLLLLTRSDGSVPVANEDAHLA